MTLPVPIITNSLESYAPMIKARGQRPRGVAELDMISKRGLQAYYGFSDAPGATELEDIWQLGGIQRNATIAGLTFDGTKGTLASALSNGITLPFTFTGSFAIYFIARVTTTGRWLNANLTGPNRGAFGDFNLAASSGNGNFQLTAYDDQASPTRLAFINALSGHPYTNNWRVFAASINVGDTETLDGAARGRSVRVRDDQRTNEQLNTNDTAALSTPGTSIILGGSASFASIGAELAGIAFYNLVPTRREENRTLRGLERMAREKGITISGRS